MCQYIPVCSTHQQIRARLYLGADACTNKSHLLWSSLGLVPSGFEINGSSTSFCTGPSPHVQDASHSRAWVCQFWRFPASSRCSSYPIHMSPTSPHLCQYTLHRSSACHQNAIGTTLVSTCQHTSTPSKAPAILTLPYPALSCPRALPPLALQPSHQSC